MWHLCFAYISKCPNDRSDFDRAVSDCTLGTRQSGAQGIGTEEGGQTFTGELLQKTKSAKVFLHPF